jgi:hypothetical protein
MMIYILAVTYHALIDGWLYKVPVEWQTIASCPSPSKYVVSSGENTPSVSRVSPYHLLNLNKHKTG